MRHEIVGPVLYLAGDASSYVTGDDMTVSGGMRKSQAPSRTAPPGQSRPYRKSTICVAGGNDPVTPEPTQPASVIMVMPLT